MSKSKYTVTEQITNAREEIKQKENRIKKLLQQQKEQDRKARTKRLCSRSGYLESRLPETITLTDEQYKTFLEKTLFGEYARKILNGLTGQSNEPKQIGFEEMAEQGNETGRRKYTQTKEGNGGNGKADEGSEETTAGT